MGMTGAERTKRSYDKKMARIAAMPKIACECGCGTMIAPISKRLTPARFAHGHNDGGEATRFQKGQAPHNKGKPGLRGASHPNWSGGEWRINGGYVRVPVDEDEARLWPTALGHGGGFSVMRSHQVWNRAHPDDVVQKGDNVHHLNHIRDDDRIENLQKMTALAHHRHHASERTLKRSMATGRFVAH